MSRNIILSVSYKRQICHSVQLAIWRSQTKCASAETVILNEVKNLAATLRANASRNLRDTFSTAAYAFALYNKD